MIIIYYRDKTTGEIDRAHLSKEGQTMADLAPLITKYNSDYPRSVVAAVEVADDSLEAYLFNKTKERKKWDQEIVQDAIEALQDALDYVRSLDG